MSTLPARFPVEDLTLPLAGLGETTVGQAPLKLASLKLSGKPTFEVAGLEIVASLEGELSAEAFNSKDDVDDMGVFGVSDAAEAGVLGPVLPAGGPDCWLKYGVNGAAKAVASGSIAEQGFSFDLSAGVKWAEFRRHGAQEKVAQALQADLGKAPRFALVPAHIEDLAEGEALAMQVTGKLGLKAEVSWSAAYSFGLGEATRLLGLKGPLSLSVGPKVGVESEVTVEDEFLVVFSRGPGGKYRIGVRKARTSKVAGGASAKVSAAVKGVDPDLVKRFLNEVTERAQIEPLLQNLGSLTPEQREKVARVAERLLVSLEDSDAAVKIKARIKDIETRAEAALKAVVASKIEVGFAYEYERVKTHTALVSVLASKEELRAFHGATVRGDLGPLLKDLRSTTPKLQLERYLNETVLSTSRAWGFSLGLGKWEISGKDKVELEEVERLNLRGDRVQRAYVGARIYDEVWVDDRRTLKVDFRAEMAGMAARDVPLVNEFGFGLSLLWDSKEKKLTRPELDDALDTAVLWNVLPQAEADDLADQLQGTVVGKEGRVVIELVMGDAVVRALMDRATRTTPLDLFPSAMAASLPLYREREERRTAGRRLEIYTPFCADFLSSPGPLAADQILRMADFHLRKQGLIKMAQLETIAAEMHKASLKHVIERSGGGLAQDAAAFHHAFAGLGRDILGGAPDRGAIKKAFKSMRDFWCQPLHLRILGVYFQRGLNVLGLRGRARASLRIEPKGEDVILIGG